ncbi:hypothetical protein P153DRAFT_402657 [Dothidotthia symphoricarpi CBS 119687]|uniref:BTB domain-containing protein n=1 Tax=Dothidotthia symphoricarpi CBS 119687 TaxID=1392245 RepID=A0A6A6AVG8_9PLEO|nr:uncharacterized protein P153DRAFT_402657 [Dothidotthia symphoricarpi CBS 119687]KAF2134847.1 hypothetical protein P153DRAFT_402657 [Dothidotthia symphoricarpi CBS 119687]
MFATPLIATRNVLSSSELYSSHRRSSSSTSSQLSRTSSNASTASTSVSTFSTASTQKRQRHFRTFSSKSAESQSTSLAFEAHPPYENQPSATPTYPDRSCTDLLVRCKSELYNVNRAVVCGHSQWFTNVCARVATTASKCVIDLSADNSDAVAAMMQYCYRLDYVDGLSSPKSDAHSCALQLHVDVYMLAQRYIIPGMMKLALRKFEALATTTLTTDSDGEDLSKVICGMYAKTSRVRDDQLRPVIIKLCAEHIEKFACGNRRTAARLFTLMGELPEFRSDIFEKVAERWK